jgi:deoxyribose-phosphate aldolase
MSIDYDYESIAKMIDHSLLNPTLTSRELDEGCALALRYNVALARCAAMLAGSTVNASTTIGFPHGGHTTAVKLAEAQKALQDGGQELDVVINISKARSGDWKYVQNELQALAQTIHSAGAKIKVIFENAYFDDAAKIRLCEICAEIGADWVKTSTGYAPSGATIPDLELMRKHSPGCTAGRAQRRCEPRGSNPDRIHAGRVPQAVGPDTHYAANGSGCGCAGGTLGHYFLAYGTRSNALRAGLLRKSARKRSAS